MDPVTLLNSIPGVGPYIPYVTLAIAIGAAVSMVLPAPSASAGAVYKALYAVVQWCALNKGHGVNLSAPSSAGIVGGPGAIAAPMVATASVPKAGGGA